MCNNLHFHQILYHGNPLASKFKKETKKQMLLAEMICNPSNPLNSMRRSRTLPTPPLMPGGFFFGNF